VYVLLYIIHIYTDTLKFGSFAPSILDKATCGLQAKSEVAAKLFQLSTCRLWLRSLVESAGLTGSKLSPLVWFNSLCSAVQHRKWFKEVGYVVPWAEYFTKLALRTAKSWRIYLGFAQKVSFHDRIPLAWLLKWLETTWKSKMVIHVILYCNSAYAKPPILIANICQHMPTSSTFKRHFHSYVKC